MKTKRKLVSKILCGVLAVTTMTSGGLMFASAYDIHYDREWRESLYPSMLSSSMQKLTDSGVYVYSHENPDPYVPHNFNAEVWELNDDDCKGSAHGGVYDIQPELEYYLPNYVYEDGCSNAAIYATKADGATCGYEINISWCADTR